MKDSLVRLTTFVLQVMPKLHLAYLVEDVEYPRPEELQASNEVKYLSTEQLVRNWSNLRSCCIQAG